MTTAPMPNQAEAGPTPTGDGFYPYRDEPSEHLLALIPGDGRVIGSVGCGYAATEAVLVARGREVHGVDVSPEAVEVARARLSSARLVGPDDRRPFDDESLDGLILGDVLEHLPAAWEALRSFCRAVRPGGWVVISVPNMRSLNVLVQFGLLGDWPEKDVGIFDRTHLQVLSRKRLARWIRDAGLVVECWQDRYDCHPRRGPINRWLDRLSLRLFHDLFMWQLQCRCRKPAPSPR